MSSSLKYSTRYYQLTSDILVEYKYTDIDVASDQSGDNSEFMYDLKNENKACIVDSAYNTSRNFLLDKYESSFVLPINRSESKFIQCVKTGKYGTKTKFWDTLVTGDMKSNPLSPDDNTSDIIKDNFRLHFTSKNYMGDYDGFILRITIYDNVKNKICLFSQYIRKTDDVEINSDPILINQKLYTTYMDFSIPSMNGILNQNLLKGEKYVKDKLSTSYGIMVNTPLCFTIYGVRGTYEYNDFECYKTEEIHTMYVPAADKFNKLSVYINEAKDGDYFEAYPVVGEGNISFSDYMNELASGNLDNYTILHELSLTEYYVDNFNEVHTDVTHREHYIVQASSAEEEVNRHMIYRPVLQHCGRLVSFVIEDQIKIINTFDNTTTVLMGEFRSSENAGCSPKKYGKRLNKIYMGNIPAQVNVYNKRADEDIDSVKITNGGSNVTIENHQHSIIGFIECTNVGVSIEQIPISTINS